MEQTLTPKKNHLQSEKSDMIAVMVELLDNINYEDFINPQINGRPKSYIVDVVKSLLIMNYHSWSYNRSRSDLKDMVEKGVINKLPAKSTLNKYMQEISFTEILQKIIEVSAMLFIEKETVFMIDAAWFFNRMIVSDSQYKYKYAKKRGKTIDLPTHVKTRKLHILIAKQSKIIVSARTSMGKSNDINYFDTLLTSAINIGFNVKTILGDAAYGSKDNYSLCDENQIDAFLQFKKNSVPGRSQSKLRREKLIIFREQPQIWYETYRFRQIVEGVFSSIKRKGRHLLRSRNGIAQENEMLLKALWHNLCVIGKFLDTL